MKFYISLMLLGHPNNIDGEKPAFSDFENKWLPTDRLTDGRTDRRTDRPSYRDARTHLKMGISEEPQILCMALLSLSKPISLFCSNSLSPQVAIVCFEKFLNTRRCMYLCACV